MKLKIKAFVASSKPYPEDWSDCKEAWNQLKKQIKAVGEDSIDWNGLTEPLSKLDAPLAKAFDDMLGSSFDKGIIQTALEASERKEGTEPRAALNFAIDILKKMKKTLVAK